MTSLYHWLIDPLDATWDKVVCQCDDEQGSPMNNSCRGTVQFRSVRFWVALCCQHYINITSVSFKFECFQLFLCISRMNFFFFDLSSLAFNLSYFQQTGFGLFSMVSKHRVVYLALVGLRRTHKATCYVVKC